MDMKILWIALAGLIGTLARWWFSGAVQRATGGIFPWGTFAVNMAGCFLFGAVWSVAEERMLISPALRIVILAGFMGAFTTFSSYMFETVSLMRDSQWFYAFGNVMLQNVTGLSCMALGLAAGKAL
ncbi:MAG: fluoride efflux transporter CrcB [Deltaproteobacteria bacterium]|nr:fluoride efflux transporter CrcB [Deltaproteobacteria bacterium]